MDEFSFGVLLYNQQELVAETLESIKFQIEEHQGAGSFNLFVIDDCSSDMSTEAVSEWLEDNRDLFNRSELIVRKENVGTVRNFNELLDLSGNSPFKVIAADDLFSSADLLNEYRQLDDYVLITHPRLDLIEKKVRLDRFSMDAYFCKMTDHKDGRPNIRQMRQGCYIHTPSTLFSKRLYEKSGCENFNRQFKLFEDDPTWYSMMKNMDGLRIIFQSTPIVLYRIHPGSISNTKSNAKSQFDIDLESLRGIYVDDAAGWEKALLRAETITDGLPKLLSVRKWKQFAALVKNHLRSSGNAAFDEFRHNIENSIVAEQSFYDSICAKAAPYKIG